ncbi:MAG: phosphoribosylformylglycinamidine synthase [bacterium]|nr:phosphoribosylformylglycinamidine synthase [bacterium]
MIYRIEISTLPGCKDIKAETAKQQIKNIFNKDIAGINTRDVYTISADISKNEAEKIGSELVNPVIQKVKIGTSSDADFDWVAIIGFLPGVTDNVGKTAFLAVNDILGRSLEKAKEKIFSSTEYLFKGKELKREDVKQIAEGLLANELIQTITILSKSDVDNDKLPDNVPYVKSTSEPSVKEIDFDVADEKLIEISKKGILALTLKEMKAIQTYFRDSKNRDEIGLKNNPTDVELECIAQTWSEHCSHKIFDAEIEYEDENGKIDKIVSCFKTFIMKSTDEIAKDVDWLVSVFHDNAGVIAFNDTTDIVFKVETHNSPSALDPYGGAMTGIVGVNRDPMGTGMGAELLINVWGYCLGSPFTDGKSVPEGLLHPRRLRDGIHKGVIDGGNQSGIPYGNGWEYFDDRYIGKPLVFCGTVGTLPKKIGDVKGFEKEILPGDLIVMSGGRIGKDGIHGATFSSEELHKDSPVQAVQIGDPITQKMMSDFIYEARDRGLYRFVTDNGAGGLSSSIGEMAEECGGCKMDLGKAPVKYAGLNPWEILVSEAQERMSFAVPQENIEEFKSLAKEREVEVSVLGEFTDSGKIHLLFNGKTVAFMDIDFLHDGCPRMQLKAKWRKPEWPEPDKKELADRNIAEDMLNMVSRLNICTDEFKGRQYDHEVKGLSVIKPFIGKDRDVRNDVGVFMLEQLGKEGIVLSSALLPRYSDIDTYHMMASAIDLAVRRTVAAGADFDHMAGLDNFCWPDPVQSDKTPDGEYKLAQLVRANQALYDYTKIFKTPCISGKDSMKNDSTRGGRKISIPPTVLFSTIAKISDIENAVSLDAKFAGDIVYIVGKTKPELGGSEYFAMLGYTGNNVPKVDGNSAYLLYQTINKLTHRNLVRSITVPELGGLGIAFAKMAMGGNLGLDIDIDKIPYDGNVCNTELIFSETNSRFVITVAKEKVDEFEKTMNGFDFSRIGEVIEAPEIRFGKYKLLVSALKDNYKATLDGI